MDRLAPRSASRPFSGRPCGVSASARQSPVRARRGASLRRSPLARRLPCGPRVPGPVGQLVALAGARATQTLSPQSEHEARCARGPGTLRSSAPHRRAPSRPHSPLQQQRCCAYRWRATGGFAGRWWHPRAQGRFRVRWTVRTRRAGLMRSRSIVLGGRPGAWTGERGCRRRPAAAASAREPQPRSQQQRTTAMRRKPTYLRQGARGPRTST